MTVLEAQVFPLSLCINLLSVKTYCWIEWIFTCECSTTDQCSNKCQLEQRILETIALINTEIKAKIALALLSYSPLEYAEDEVMHNP